MGDTLVVLGAVFWSLHIIFVGKIIKEFDAPLLIGLIQTITVSFCSIILALIFEDIILINILEQKIQILYAGLLSGGIAFVLQIYAQKNISPAPAAIIFSLEGVFATVAAWMILSQILNFKYKESIEQAIKSIKLKENDIIIVTGSLYLASEVLNLN